jgi:hypothetical protein
LNSHEMDKIYGRAIGRGRFDTVSEKRTVSTRFADFLICSYDTVHSLKIFQNPEFLVSSLDEHKPYLDNRTN